MRRVILIVITSLLINRCFATGLTHLLGGRSAAMGRTSVCERGLWALSNNPAGLSELQGWHGGLYYENPWMLRETAFKSAGAVKSIDGVGCLGLLVSQHGWSAHSENLFGIAFARGFGPYLQMGLRADWVWIHMGEGYPDRHLPSVALGLQSQVTDKLCLGAALFNPAPGAMKTLHEDRLPVVMRVGGSYRFTDDFVGQCELEKDSQVPGLRLSAGFEYTLFQHVFLRAGAQHNPNLISFGVGYETKWLRIDVAAQMQMELGASVSVGSER